MTAFIPPYPKRPAQSLNPVEILYRARKDLLSIWSEDYFKVQFRVAKILKRPMYIINCPALVRHVFETKQEIYQQKSAFLQKALQNLLGDGLFISAGLTWQTRRPLVESLFGEQHLSGYVQHMIAAVEDLGARWSGLPEGSVVQVLPEMAQLTLEINSRCLFGNLLTQEQKRDLQQSFGEYQGMLEKMDIGSFLGLSGWLPNTQSGQIRHTAARLHELVDALIGKGMQQPNPDGMLGLLLDANRKGAVLTPEQLRSEVLVLFLSGYAATAYTLTWAWYLLSQCPGVQERLHQELEQVLDGGAPVYGALDRLHYTRAILNESMRLYPPMPLLARQSSADDVIRKHCIPVGATMLIVPWLLHRHSMYWDKPDHFMPERFLPEADAKIDPFAFIPFGAGPRKCLGENFAMAAMLICLALLARHFRLSLPPATEIKHECRLFLRPQGNMPMHLHHLQTVSA